MRFFFLFLFSLQAMAQNAELSLQDLQERGLHSYWNKERSFLLVEGKSKEEQALFLLDIPYALVQGHFIALPQVLRVSAEQVYFPQKAIASYLPFLADKAAPKAIGSTAHCSADHAIGKIFIDPGHGGADFGTKSGHLNEKDLTLRFSTLIAAELRKHGFAVGFSRTKDIFLPLDIRSELAKEWKADVFLSIHINSAPSKSVHGTETYILSNDATDAAARKLALLENSIAQEVKSKQSAVQDILWDMEQTLYLQDSAFLASYIQKQIVSNTHKLMRNRGVRQAPFFVLSRASMPAVLVEMGYLSNAQDRMLLADKNFQENLAKAVAEGVRHYQEACKLR